MVKNLTDLEFYNVWQEGFKYNFAKPTVINKNPIQNFIEFFQAVPLNLPAMQRVYLQVMNKDNGEDTINKMRTAMEFYVVRWLETDAKDFIHSVVVKCDEENNPPHLITPVVNLSVTPTIVGGKYMVEFWLGNQQPM